MIRARQDALSQFDAHGLDGKLREQTGRHFCRQGLDQRPWTLRCQRPQPHGHGGVVSGAGDFILHRLKPRCQTQGDIHRQRLPAGPLLRRHADECGQLQAPEMDAVRCVDAHKRLAFFASVALMHHLVVPHFDEAVVTAVRLGIVQRDEVVAQQMQQAVINGVHAITPTDLD